MDFAFPISQKILPQLDVPSRKSINKLTANSSLVLGMTCISCGSTLNFEFKSGLYYLGKKRPDLELVPVYIDNMNRVLPRGEFLPVPLLSCITIGPPMWLEAGEPKSEFLQRAREAVRRLKDF